MILGKEIELMNYIFISVSISGSKHDCFLTNFAAAWNCADILNKIILKSTAIDIIAKYVLNTEDYLPFMQD